MISFHRRRQAARMGAGKSMKRTSFAVTLLVLTAGLLADPLFCCALPKGDQPATVSAPAMDCCAEGTTPACAPKVEKAASLAPVAGSEIPVFVAAIALPAAPPPGPAFLYASALIERPPRFDLPSSPLRI
jgi:hypothetical protein